MMLAAALVVLVLLHRADGGLVQVAVGQVTSLHAAAGPQNKLVNPKAGCAIWLADGRMLSVIEPCDVVRRLLDEAVAAAR
jgi:hypothetical protein